MQNCGYFTKLPKLRQWRHTPLLTATVVATDSHHRFSKRRHVANVKTITGDDSRSKFCRYCVYLSILRLFMSTRSQLLLCGWWQRQLPRTRTIVFRRDDTLPTSKNIASDDHAILMIDRNSANNTYTFRFYVYEISTGAQWHTATAVAMDSLFFEGWHVANVKNIAGDDQDWSIEILQ